MWTIVMWCGIQRQLQPLENTICLHSARLLGLCEKDCYSEVLAFRCFPTHAMEFHIYLVDVDVDVDFDVDVDVINQLSNTHAYILRLDKPQTACARNQ